MCKIQVINNIFWKNSPDQIRADANYEPDVTYSCVQGGYPGAGNFHGDPLFVDPENLDFHLQTSSPCMYAGTPEGAPDIDFEGNPRPQGYGYDIGAYETNGYDRNRPIIDSFTSDRIEGDLPFDVSFSGSAHDPDGTIVSYSIDYGDGTPPETNQTGDFVHTYTTIGNGDVILTVTDDSDAATNSHSILIKRYGIVHVPSEYPTIQNAVDALLDGNTIVVADGVYTGEGNTNINVHGKVLTIKSLNGPGNCIIDCQGTGRGFIFENGETEETVISGFTILNGNGDAETKDSSGRNRGGGIYCYGASPTIDNCIVKGNTAFVGGGFYCDESSPTIINCSFLENTSSSYGGGLCFRDSTASMSNCIVRKNTSDSYGGGISSFYTDTPTSIINCVIADNSAAYAGGIYASGDYGLCSITNCTITRNSAQNSGGGILCDGWISLDVSNSILWNNTPDEIRSSPYNTLTVSYSAVQGEYEGEGNFHGNPLFADPESNDFRLTISSPCIDAGTSTDAPDSDIQGTPRPQGLAHDIGAYEAPDYGGTRPVIESFSSDITEGDIPLTIEFTCSAHDPDGEIVGYTMDYGDGSPSETNTSGVFSYTYTAAGLGYATCIVLNNDGTSINSKSIIIKRYGVMHVPSEYQTIQCAIDAQFENGIIHVADGTYTGEGNKNIDFKGKAITLLSENGPLNTVIDCEGEGTGFIFRNGEAEDTVVSGFSITGGSGRLEDSNIYSSGGGIYCINASPTIYNCFINGNTATYGGGIYCSSSSTPRITKCEVSENIANDGGGLYCNRSSNPVITDCLIQSNSAQRGGGVYSFESGPNIVNSTIVHNTSHSEGGGIYCSSQSSVNITNTTISENTVYQNSVYQYNGGGIYCHYYSSLTISNSIIWGDSPDEIVLGYNSDAVLAYCLIQGGWEGGTGIIDTAPLFGADHHLQAGSPCRNAGDPSSSSPQFPENDIDGEARPQGNAYDIGSDEFYDSDGDDIPDYWEYIWFGDLSHDESTNADTDTLTDLEEFQNATNPLKPDSDDDGLSDSVESESCTNPNDADTDDDSIPDGIEDFNHNGQADLNETDPCDPDTDNDGIPDGIEDFNHNGQVDLYETDPCNPDTDNDGLTDGEEDSNYNGILDEGETSPLSSDTDEDGMPDNWEVAYGLNPRFDDSEADKDGDGQCNLGEYLTGTNPDNSNDYRFYPVADAGEDQTDIIEGETVTLYGTNSSDADDGIASYFWEQIGDGPDVSLSDETDVLPTFVAPPVDTEDMTLTFRLTVTDTGGLTSEDTVSITIHDNGITAFPVNIITFYTSTTEDAGLALEEGGDIVALDIIEPSTISDTRNRPADLLYGLMDFNFRTDIPGGTVRVTIYLPSPVPEGYTWYKYNKNKGWIDFSSNASFNAARDQVTLTLTDGGAGDDDGVANGIIIDPSGLGSAPLDPPATGGSGGGGGGGGGSGIFGTIDIEELTGYHLDVTLKDGTAVYMPVTDWIKALKGAQTHVEGFSPGLANFVRESFDALEREAKTNQDGFLSKTGTYLFPVLGDIAKIYLGIVDSVELMDDAYADTTISIDEFNKLEEQGAAVSSHVVKADSK